MSKMILIIEDEESIQNIIKAFLEDAGYTVVLAADGLEGIEPNPEQPFYIQTVRGVGYRFNKEA